ncbi:MAG: hypothetical protein CMH83_10855 [Nocardioides sp.]|nr:hypothetical protein [Nocardioides sp.]
MTTIDLSVPPPPADGLLDSLPRRVTLTLPELRLAAELAGGAPLPFEEVALEAGASGPSGLSGRLGATPASSEAQALRAVLDRLPDPHTSLARRGLLVGDDLDPGVAGAVGLLATPRVAVDVDVAVAAPTGRTRVRAWHRQGRRAVAALATADGVVFELAWFPTAAWSDELARVAVLPEDLPLRESLVPTWVELPYALADGAGEAAAEQRHDLLGVLAAEHAGEVRDRDGRAFGDIEAAHLLQALSSEAHGRLRVLVADVGRRSRADVVGVRSWVLVNDGWRALHPVGAVDDEPRLRVERRDASELAADLAPVLAEVD